MDDAQTLEPTADRDGFTDQERAQFEGMRETEAPAETPAAPEPVMPESTPQVETPAAAAPQADDGADDDDDETDAPAAAAPVPGQPPQDRPPRRVNYQKFQRMEARAKAAETSLRERDQVMARLDERLKILNEALATPQQPNQPQVDQDPEPDPEKDIFGHNSWLKRQLVKQGEALQAIQSGRQTETEESQVARTYETDARQFVATEPNFVPAYQHLMGVRLAQLSAYFYDKEPTELSAKEVEHIKRTAAEEERQVVSEALKNGLSPAKRIFQLAKASGFRPQAAEAPNAGNGAAAPKPNGNGAHAPNGNGAAAAPSVSDEIARIKAGQDASLSLSSAGGAPSNPMTAERLANMPQAEFERWMENTPPEVIRELMGG